MDRPVNRRALMMLGLASAGLAASGLATAALAQPGPPPYPPVPALREEVVPVHPGGRVVWEPGHWRWGGREYVWVPGRYAPIGRVHARWVPGHWAWRRGAWHWDGAHWE